MGTTAMPSATAVAEHWIDGEWIGSGTVSESVNPATGEVLGRWADGGEDEARAAIAAARRAFDTAPWFRDRNLRNRALSEMADRFDAHADELGPLVTKENGKKLPEGMLESTTAGATMRHAAALALTDAGISAEIAPGQWFSTYAEPAGVVAIIVPWNAPVALLVRSLGPALAAGNTVAVKMPGQTALVANMVSRIIAEVESLPRGVVNIFSESGNTGAPYLVASPDVQVVSYTGSSPVGRLIAAAGAVTLKRMNLELGGKTPMIVFEDAVARVDGMVEAALTYAKPILRGGAVTDGVLAAGAFYRPALLEVEDVNSEIVQKEVFGPVATFEVFDTEADAIWRANAGEMGLAAGLFTNDINISRRVSREIQAGTIWTNGWAAINDGFAQGGYKQSGVGRLRGPLAITEFQEAKTVVHSIPPASDHNSGH